MNVDQFQRKPGRQPVLKQFFFLFLVIITSYFIFALLGIRLASYIFGVDINILLSGDFHDASRDVVNALKFMQVFSSAGIFLAPAILFPLYLSKKPVKYVGLDKKINTTLIFQIIFLFVVMNPFLEWLIDINNKIVLPESMKSFEVFFRTWEEKTESLTNIFLRMYNYRDFITNIIIIAFIPALLEEMFFRGIFQNFLHGILKNSHLVIFISAAFFSMVHMSFYGFIPRLVLGLVLGYLFYWTGSLWASVFAHFLNNVVAVILVFLSQINLINFQIDKPMVSSNLMIIISFALAALFFFFLASYYSKKRDKRKNWILIYTSNNVAEVEIIKGKLENNGITAVMMNKRDSTYQVFGTVELYVNPEDEQHALEILKQEDSLTEDINDSENLKDE